MLIATGAAERLIAFPGNDVPGVMLAGAALAYLRRYGVAVGAHPVFFVNNDEAYEAAVCPARGRHALRRCRRRARALTRAAERARALGHRGVRSSRS